MNKLSTFILGLGLILGLSACGSDAPNLNLESLSGSVNKVAGAKEFTDLNFQNQVLNSNQLVIVDFWAPWSASSRQMNPILEELASEMAGKVIVGTVNADKNTETVMEYNIRSLPTVLIIKNGEVVERIVGKTTTPALRATIQKHLS